MKIVGILLAAGASTRFHGDKLRATYRGCELYRHALDALSKSPEIHETIMVVNLDFDPPRDYPECRFVINTSPEEGMSSSLREGILAASLSADAYVIALADMPRITPDLVAAVVGHYAESRKGMAVPVCRGRNGHPVVISAEFRDELLALHGDIGARELIRKHPESVSYFELDDDAVLFDVDTPDDLYLLAKRGRSAGAGVVQRILIKGAGEMASAIAHRLFRCGFHVVMTDLAAPTAVRRRVSFCSAIYDHEVTIEGVRGASYAVADCDFLSRFGWDHVPVFVDPDCSLRAIWKPDVVIDARMLKKNLDNHVNDAQLVIGLGPDLEAGKDAHYVVETNRGHCLGRIIDRGKADENTGVPGDVGGYTHERVLRAPSDGVFESDQEIGNVVKSGDVMGRVNGSDVNAKIDGVIRGIIMPGIRVCAGQKLADIDPRGNPEFCDLISDKARTISGSVLEIVVSHAVKQDY